jgi:hypothetical protein
MAREIECAVESRLPAHRRQQRVGPFERDDLLDHLPVDGLDIRRIGHFRIGHDRRRIRIYEHDAVAFLPERLARLHAGIIELARLSDDDRTCADDQNGFDVGSFGHGVKG